MDTKTNNSIHANLQHADSQGKDIIVISDLHLASGLNAHGNYDGTENFYADDSFQRFVNYLYLSQVNNKTILVINGDFIDFLRITNYPKTEQEFVDWQQFLSSVGMHKTIDELKQSISKKEERYGLKTNDYKTAWKLNVCAKGHPVLFHQLSDWVSNGNQLFIVKGNHDLEWMWPLVQQYFRVLLTSLTRGIDNSSLVENIVFVDDALVIDQKVYIEHGHKHENITSVKGDDTVNNGTELNLPFGSFFNRYLINRLELAYPFLDNVRPSTNILPILLRERFPLAIKVLLYYIPFTLLIIPKKLYWQSLKYLLQVILVIVLPIAITVYAVYSSFSAQPATSSSFVGKQIMSVAKNFGFLFLSYIFGRLMAMAQLSAPVTHIPDARRIFAAFPGFSIVTYGHSHNPQQAMLDGKFYFNTGTWMPVFDISIADVRIEKTYTYLSIKKDSYGNIASQQLLRWNDDAGRADMMVLCDRK